MKKIVICYFIVVCFVSTNCFAQEVSIFKGKKGGSFSKNSNANEGDFEKKIADAKRRVMRGPPGFSLSGKVEKGINSKYSINGEDFEIAADAISNAPMREGEFAIVEGELQDGRKIGKNVNIAKKGKETSGMDYSVPSEARQLN